MSDYKEEITTYAVQLGMHIKFSKNDKHRVMFICKEGCDWNAYCVKLPNEDTWQLRKVVDVYKCSRAHNVNMMTTKWLSKRIQNSLKDSLKMKIKGIKEKYQRKWHVGVNKTKTVRARCASKGMVDGFFLE